MTTKPRIILVCVNSVQPSLSLGTLEIMLFVRPARGHGGPHRVKCSFVFHGFGRKMWIVSYGILYFIEVWFSAG